MLTIAEKARTITYRLSSLKAERKTIGEISGIGGEMLHGKTTHPTDEIGESSMVEQFFVIDMGHGANGRCTFVGIVVIELLQRHCHHIHIEEEGIDAPRHFINVLTIRQSLHIAQSGDGSPRNSGKYLYVTEQRSRRGLDMMEKRECPQMEGGSPVASSGKC